MERLRNIGNAQKGLINGNNKPDSKRTKLNIQSIFDSISSKSKDEDEDENEKTARWLYQDGIEDIEGLKLPGEIESKDEKSQIYLENDLNKPKIFFSDIYDKYQRFFKYIANKEKAILNTKYFHIKLIILIFIIDIIHCTTI